MAKKKKPKMPKRRIPIAPPTIRHKDKSKYDRERDKKQRERDGE